MHGEPFSNHEPLTWSNLEASEDSQNKNVKSKNSSCCGVTEELKVLTCARCGEITAGWRPWSCRPANSSSVMWRAPRETLTFDLWPVTMKNRYVTVKEGTLENVDFLSNILSCCAISTHFLQTIWFLFLILKRFVYNHSSFALDIPSLPLCLILLWFGFLAKLNISFNFGGNSEHQRD